ncbi:MAG TPA: HD domain-containing phosphohydrolase [Bryobacteraceae bacterium]
MPAIDRAHLLAPKPRIPEPDLGRGDILLVDSSAHRKRSMRQCLEGFENRVVEAGTTSEAVVSILTGHVDLILINAQAPEVGAADFCRAIRKAPATQFLPVFVVASSDDPETEVRAIEAGASDFLTTPFRTPAFRARVQASLRYKAMIDSLDDSETILFSLAKSVEDRDPDLSHHCQRLALMGAALGEALKLSAEDILALQRGGYLHDIGKISIPDRILFKAGPLTKEEWDIMKSHPERGERICGNLRSLASVLPIIRSHHERWDGSGYPDGLAGHDIPLLAQVMQMADIYDALTTARPYKRAFTSEEALRIMWEETAKGWRDPELMKVFADLLPTFRRFDPHDLSRVSLQALASSIESFRCSPLVSLAS